MANQHTKARENEQDFLKLARQRFDLAAEAEAELRKDALDDLKFRAGEQWPDDVKRGRELDKRPCLTINRIPQFIRQVTNDQRQNRPAIQVNPVDDKGDTDTAEVLQGLIRHIEYDSNADVAYDTAFDAAATHGRGYFRVVTDYCNPMSFEQDIKIKRIRNPFTVYMDPTCQEPDYSDAGWGFVVEDLAEDEYKDLYPGSEMASLNDWQSIGDKAPGWVTKGSCRIAEYFYKSFKEVTLVLLSDKTVVPKDKLPELPEGVQIVAERKSQLPIIKWAKINAVETLDETDWPGMWIPIVPVLGDELDVDGKVILEGIVRHAKDPQRMYNYWASAETETIALAPRAPFIGAEGQFEGNENTWKQANTRNLAYLEYKPKALNGTPLPPPARNVYEPPVQAITQARMQSADDLKATTGIYDAALGARSNENSGVAIQRRNMQSQTSNFHYIDNLTRAIRHLGRILIDLIPKVYDTPRVVRIIGEDGDQKTVAVNQLFEMNGEQKTYDFGVGKYDVTVQAGPSFATKRQEAVQSMLQLTQSYPKVAEVASDLMVKNMDWPGAKEIAERLKKTLPPNLQEPEDGKPQMPPQLQAQIQQMQQMIEQLTTSLNAAQDQLEGKEMELESKERIAFAQMHVDLMKTMATIDSKEALSAFQGELAHISERLNLLGIQQPIEEEAPAQEQTEQTGQPAGMQPEAPEQEPMGQPETATGGVAPGQPMEQ